MTTKDRGVGRGSGMLERMDAFFEARLPGYEAHQLTCIDSA